MYGLWGGWDHHQALHPNLLHAVEETGDRHCWPNVERVEVEVPSLYAISCSANTDHLRLCVCVEDVVPFSRKSAVCLKKYVN